MQNFNFYLPYIVRVADINYGGHVANSSVLNIFQDGRISYLGHLGPYTELDVGGCGIILPEAQVFFRKEMFLNDQLQVGVRCSEIKRSGFVLDYRIERNGEVTAEGRTPVSCFDYQRRKPVRIPQLFSDALGAFDGL